MTRYEFVFLLNDEEEIKNIKDIVKSISGKLLEEKKWGKKALAYPIAKNNSADFYEWFLEMGEESIADFKRKSTLLQEYFQWRYYENLTNFSVFEESN